MQVQKYKKRLECQEAEERERKNKICRLEGTFQKEQVHSSSRSAIPSIMLQEVVMHVKSADSVITVVRKEQSKIYSHSSQL